MNNLKFQFTQYYFMFFQFHTADFSGSDHCGKLWDDWLIKVYRDLNEEEIEVFHYTTEDVFDPPCNYLRRPVLYLSPETVEFLEEDMAEFLKQAREDFAKQVKNESDLRNMIKGIDGIDLE